MSFVKRGLGCYIRLNNGGMADEDTGGPESFDNGTTALNLDHMRAVATVQSVIGGDTGYGGSALIQIWGMKPADMATLSTLGFDQHKINRNTISLFAYDLDKPGQQVEVFTGGIFVAHVNYNAMPDVSVELQCWATGNQQAAAIDSTSMQGAVSIATFLQAVCGKSDPPVTFVNHGADVQLTNPAFSGSQAQQIMDACVAAGVCYQLQDDTLTIWDKDQPADDVIVTIGPGNGMLGYPEYTNIGMDVTMEFNPKVQLGRQVTIQQANTGNPPPIPGVPGTYWCNVVSHELSSEMPGGPWYTRASVSNVQIVGRT